MIELVTNDWGGGGGADMPRTAGNDGGGFSPAYSGGSIYTAASVATGAPAGGSYGSGIVTPYLGNNNDTRAVGAAFDANARAVTSYYGQLANQQGGITETQYQTALAAFNDLTTFASEHNIEYVRRQWDTAAYRPAYLRWLEQLRGLLGASQEPDSTEPRTDDDPSGTEPDDPVPPVTEEETSLQRLADLLSQISAFSGGSESEPRTQTTYTPAAGAGSGNSGVLMLLAVGAVVVVGYLYFKHKKKGGESNG
jgi:hypothetical protein